MRPTTEGIANDAKKVTTAGSRELQLQLQMRVRQPRVIGSDGVLCAYPRTPPLEVLIETDEQQLEEQGKKLAAARQSSRAGAASAPSS